MMKFTRIVKAVSLVAIWVVLFMTTEAHAQSQWGYGMYGGMSQCGYEVDIGDDATNIQDQIDELKELREKTKEDLRDLKSEISKLTSEVNSAKLKVSLYGLKPDAFRFVETHIVQAKRCCDYESVVCSGSKIEKICKDEKDCDSGSKTEGGEGPRRGTNSVKDFGYAWGGACGKDGDGTVFPRDVCSAKGAIKEGSLYKANDCETGLTDWQKKQKVLNEKNAELIALKALETEQKTAIAALTKGKKKAIREYEKEKRQEMTEGGCVGCMMAQGTVMQQKKSSTGEIIGNVALGLVGTLAGASLNRHISDNNAKLGWASEPYPALMYGFPYYMNAFYGAMGGGIGSGGFGCGSGYGNGMGGGAFGYPNSMYGSPYGGGMYMPGMGPWGMAGPGGMGGMYPGGMMVAGGMMMGGNMMGMPMGMMVAGGAMMGMPMGMMAGGGMMGMPMGGYMMGGGAMMGMPMGMMAGGGMMGMPMGGYMMSGGAMMGMMSGGYMMGGAMMGMPMGGYMMSGGAMMGMMSSGYMMAGGAMMGGMMDGGAAQMQMQQQMMQMQMQQYQSYMQMQQQQMQQQMARTQALSGLQQELSSLMYRIQQVQTGVNTGGYIGFGGSTSVYPNTPYPATYPATTYPTTTVPTGGASSR